MDKTLTIGSVDGAIGGKVTVPIGIDNPSGLNSVDLTIKYDPNLLDIVDPDPTTDINEGVTRTGVSQDWQLVNDENPNQELPNPVANVVEEGTVRIALTNPGAVPTATTNSDLLNVEFLIDPSADLNDVANIELSAAELGVDGEQVNLNDTLLKDGNVTINQEAITSLDIDGNGEVKALTDGILIVRHLFNFSGDSLIDGAIANGATRTSSQEIQAYLTEIGSSLDIDGNGEAKALTDGILIVRHLFNFSGDSLIDGAIANGATRTSADQIASAIDSLIV